MLNRKDQEKVGQDELYDLLIGKEASWQAIIYDLVKSEQLDPWDIDLAVLSRSYIEKIKELEEASLFVSSKILLAAAILLRIKSELLLKRYIRSLDEILFGKPEEKEKEEVYIQLDDVDLLPRTPLPRLRKVTLQELMTALNKAMATEHRRIKKEILLRQAAREVAFEIPKIRINIRQKIREIYEKILRFFKTTRKEKLSFTQLAGTKREERISTFIPLLHLDNQEKVLLEQEQHFGEILISLI